jgi:hypothetical protein
VPASQRAPAASRSTACTGRRKGPSRGGIRTASRWPSTLGPSYHDKYVKFLRGIYRAVDYFYANQEEAIPIIASFFSITPEEFKETLPNFRYTPYEETAGFIGTAEAPGRAYEVFRDTMGLNLEFGSSDVELFPEDHITPEIISQVEKDWE